MKNLSMYHSFTDVNLYNGVSNTGSMDYSIKNYRDVLKFALQELDDPNVTIVRIGEYHGDFTDQYVVNSVSLYSTATEGIMNY